MTCYVVPNYISDAINKRLDEEIAKNPGAAADRELFYEQLIGVVAETGQVPDFSLCKKSTSPIQEDAGTAQKAPGDR